MHTRTPQTPKGYVTFGQLWEQGWKTLIPVIPPEVPLSPYSKIPADQRGKVPGIRFPDGWGGLADWQNLTPTREDYRKWDRMDASIGCRCDELIAFDCDIPDKELSLAVLECLWRLGIPGLDRNSAFRVGQSPKWLLPARIAGGHRSFNLTFSHPRVSEPTFQFQGLGQGRQFVVWGVHPKTRELYRWSSNQRPPVVHTLPAVDVAQIETIKAAVVSALQALGATLVTTSNSPDHDAAPANQAQLKGTPELVRDALTRIPNDMHYDEWQLIAAALNGAAQDWPEQGLQLFLEFTQRCTRVTPDLTDAQRKYLSYHPPFRLGAQYLYDKAVTHGFNKAAADFQIDPTLAAARAAQTTTDRKVAARKDGAVEWGVEVRRVLPQTTSEQSRFADVAVAHRFIDAHRERLIYVGERGLWHAWDGERWRPDNTRTVHDLLLQEFLTAEAIRAKNTAADTKKELEERHKLVTRLLSTTMHKNVAAAIRAPMTVSQEMLDRDAWALNTPDGLIDLRTGQYVTVNRKRYLTRITSVSPAAPGAKPARWLQFLDEVTQGDTELASWLQRALGYTLAGELSEQVFFFLWGSGGNGKGVLMHTVKELLGSYTTTADRSVFLKSRFQEHATVRASLAGARLILVPEVQVGAEWHEAVLKEFSGGDQIKARFIGRDEFEFTPQGTLWFSGNDRPSLSKVDPAIERRFRLVTFDFSPAKPDPHLKSHLVEKEGPAILRWLLDGYLMWQLNGLGTAKAVTAGTQDYLAEFDPVRRWARDSCTVGVGEADGGAELWESFRAWQQAHLTDNNGTLLTQQNFAQRLRMLPGVSVRKSGGRMRYEGITRRVRAVA